MPSAHRSLANANFPWTFGIPSTRGAEIPIPSPTRSRTPVSADLALIPHAPLRSSRPASPSCPLGDPPGYPVALGGQGFLFHAGQATPLHHPAALHEQVPDPPRRAERQRGHRVRVGSGERQASHVEQGHVGPLPRLQGPDLVLPAQAG